jgi:uncharacterized protein
MFQGLIDTSTAAPVEATAVPDIPFEQGLYWASGRSGVVDLVAAHKWFNLAAIKGRIDAAGLRREVAELMSEAEVALAQREARAWMTARADFRAEQNSWRSSRTRLRPATSRPAESLTQPFFGVRNRRRSPNGRHGYSERVRAVSMSAEPTCRHPRSSGFPS